MLLLLSEAFIYLHRKLSHDSVFLFCSIGSSNLNLLRDSLDTNGNKKQTNKQKSIICRFAVSSIFSCPQIENYFGRRNYYKDPR